MNFSIFTAVASGALGSGRPGVAVGTEQHAARATHDFAEIPLSVAYDPSGAVATYRPVIALLPPETRARSIGCRFIPNARMGFGRPLR